MVLHLEAKAELRREVARLAWPVILQNLLKTALFFVDSLMVARVGAAALGSLGVAGSILWSIHSQFMSLTRGSVAVVARATGEGRPERAREVAAQALGASLLLGMAGAAVLYPATQWIVRVMGAHGEVATLAVDYMGVQLLTLPLYAGYESLSASFQAAGDTRTPMRVGAAGIAFNIVGNWLLIFGHLGFPELGVFGASLATAAAQLLELTLLLLCFRPDRCRVLPGTYWKLSKWELPLLCQMAWIAGPALLEGLIFHAGFLAFNRVVFGLSTEEVAAHRIDLSLEALCFMPAAGMAVASSALVGQRLGAGKPEAAEEAGWMASRMILEGMLCLSAAFVLFPGVLVGMFVSEGPVHHVATACLRISAAELPFLGVASVLMAALQGAGDTRSPLLASLVGSWGIRVPGTVLAVWGLGYGLPAVWWVTALEWLMRTAILGWLFRRGSWKAIPIHTGGVNREQ